MVGDNGGSTMPYSNVSYPTVGTDSDGGNVEYLLSVNYTKPFCISLAAIEASDMSH